jgi:peptidoglycan/LPS O-acetylase OafA/YrhL
MNASPSQPAYFQSLQAFRGLAALAVVLHHAGLFSHRQLGQTFCADAFDGGMIGVDFFFVLSGFIITSVHGRDLGQPERAPNYVLRRFFRIYPLLFLLTAAKLAIELIQGTDRSLGLVLSSFLMLPPAGGEYPIITAAWTLQHEALFYALFLVAIVIGKRVALWLVALWVALMIVARFAALEGIVAFVLHPHNIQFLIGCGTAAILARWKQSSLVPAGALIAFALVLAIGRADALVWRACLGCGFAGILLLGTVVERSWPVPAFLRVLGDASYSIYLAHTPLLLIFVKLSKRWVGDDSIRAHLAIAIGVMLAIGFGLAVYRLVERPLLLWSRRFTPRSS